MELQLLSLFCGAGGLDYGFRCSGFKTVLALDICADAVRSFNRNAQESVARVADISHLSPEAFLEHVPLSAQPIGLIGGPPCQGFSRGNATAAPNDPRNLLPYRYADLLAAANEKYGLHFFVFENVTGLATSKHAARFKRIAARLGRAGFRLFTAELDAASFAVPQRRRRLFVVGLNTELHRNVDFAFPVGDARRRIVADAIRDLPLPRFYSRGLEPRDIPFHPNHWTMMPKSDKLKRGGCSSGRSFRRLAWDEVSPTVAYGHREVHVHPDGGRRLSVFEAMLLQGFPSDYVLEGSLSSQITQVSNAVPPPVAEALARSIKYALPWADL